MSNFTFISFRPLVELLPLLLLLIIDSVDKYSIIAILFFNQLYPRSLDAFKLIHSSDPDVKQFLILREALMDYALAKSLCTIGVKPASFRSIIPPDLTLSAQSSKSTSGVILTSVLVRSDL